MEGAVDERVHHRVRHAAEEDPHRHAVVHVLREDELDEDDVVGRPAADERQHDHRRHAQRLDLGLAEELAAHGAAREHVFLLVTRLQFRL